MSKSRKVLCHWHLEDLGELIGFCQKWRLEYHSSRGNSVSKDTDVQKSGVILGIIKAAPYY